MKRFIDETPKPVKILRTDSNEKNMLLHKSPVNVYCRLKPLQKETGIPSIKLISDTALSVSSESKSSGKATNYIFRHIFKSHDNQKVVFEKVALPLLENLFNGKSSLLFTYGVTGAGKTFTLTGEQDNPGIIPCCINTLFNTIENNHQIPKYAIKPDRMNGFELLSQSDALEERFKATKSKPRVATRKKPIVFNNYGTKINNVLQSASFAVFISYIEIYNNNVYDLLDETSGKILQSKILREDSSKGMYVNGAVEVEVRSADDAFDVFFVGQMRKRMGNTVLNAESSRSHSIFIIRIVQLEDDKIRTSQFSLVDLAGSERSKRTQTVGARLKEASSINNSLLTLRTCFEILKENQMNGTNRLVPYRDSRLTLLFKSYFEGMGHICMVVCINPTFDDYEENIQVLKFAETSQDVKIPQSESKYVRVQSKTPKLPKDFKVIHTPATLKAKKTLRYKFTIPNIVLSCEDPDANIAALDSFIIALKNTKQKRVALKQESEDKENTFRNRLLKVHQVSNSVHDEVKHTKSVSHNQQHTSAKLENKIANLELCNNELKVKNQALQSKIQSLNLVIEEKNLKINRDYLHCEKSKRKLAVESEKMCQDLNKKLKRQYTELQANMEHKTTKLQRVKEFLNEETPRNIVLNANTSFEYNPQQTPPMTRRNLNKTVHYRRSRSAGEIYLEHNVVKPVPLGTLFQPSMNKRKTVVALETMKDITSAKQNRYCLVAQETDVDGEIETKLYKGDILPTCGGGAQVIFDDVERLKQESPTK